MIDHLTYQDKTLYVYPQDSSLKTTKAFTHGSIVFDSVARTAVFAKLPPVALPEGLLLEKGLNLQLRLMTIGGLQRKQRREGVLSANEKQPGILHMGGMAKTPRLFSAEDGWTNEIYKYRAYFTHPGINTSIDDESEQGTGLPQWLKDCIGRQKALWNRLAWLCRDARRKCSPAPTAEIIEFVNNTILPEIDAFNLMLGRARTKEKMRHPAKLKIEMPGIDGLWSFVGELRGRIEKKRAVPDGLLEKVVGFAEQFKAEYTPLNEFMNDFAAIAEREAVALGLRRFEIRPTVGAFKAVLDRRKTTKAPWSEGWPLLKYPDSPKAANWGVHYYFNKAGVDSTLLESGSGVPALSFGLPLPPSETGHKEMTGKRVEYRRMREATISIPGDEPEKTRHDFRFAVLQHRALPPNSHLKEWKLIYQDGKLWLCLVVELQRPVPKPAAVLSAGLEIGWRRTEEGIRFATLYEPATKTIREAMIDFQRSPKDHKDRTAFRIDLGPTRWEKHHITALHPKWKPGEAIPGIIETRMALAARCDYLKDTAKILLRKHLGERTPAWLEKAGSNGLHKVALEFMDDPTVLEIVNDWEKKNKEVRKLTSAYFDQTTKRVEYGHAQVAHDICRYLKEKGIERLIVEDSFLSKVAQRHDNEDPESLKRSQKYRQFVAPAKFIGILKNTAVKYGYAVEAHENINLTRICHFCDHLNPSNEKEKFNCEGCGREIKQDHNTAINLVRFDGDPALAEKALHSGSKE